MLLFQSRFRLCVMRFLIGAARSSLCFRIGLYSFCVNIHCRRKVCRFHRQGICRCAALVLRTGLGLGLLYCLTDGCHAAAGFLGLFLGLLLGNGYIALYHAVTGRA